MSEENEGMLRNALDAVDRGRRWAFIGLAALFVAMAIALLAMMAAAAHIGQASSDAFMLKILYVASAAQMLFVACCTAAVMFQFTRMMKAILRAIESR